VNVRSGNGAALAQPEMEAPAICLYKRYAANRRLYGTATQDDGLFISQKGIRTAWEYKYNAINSLKQRSCTF
jgi:hypothetical protein